MSPTGVESNEAHHSADASQPNRLIWHYITPGQGSTDKEAQCMEPAQGTLLLPWVLLNRGAIETAITVALLSLANKE